MNSSFISAFPQKSMKHRKWKILKHDTKETPMNEQTFRDLKAKTVEDLFRIGKCYETGDGVGKNETAAVRWYRLAAEQGLADAMFELSKCY